MEKKLLRKEKAGETYNYVYEEMMPQEVIKTFSVEEHNRNEESAKERRATITEEKLQLEKEIEDLNEELTKINRFLDIELIEIEPEEEIEEEEQEEQEE